MLESFEITNFRLFQHLQVKKLSRVNLIVGKNNSGKSSFLEALEIYASNASPTVFLDLLESRQDDWFSEAKSHSQNPFENPFRHLFFEHKLLGLKEEGISLGEISSKRLAIGIGFYQFLTYGDGKQLARVDYQTLLPGFYEDPSDFEMYLIVEEGEKIRRLFSLDSDDIRRRSSRMSNRLQEPESKYIWQSVSTKNMSNQKLSDLWDLTSLDPELKSEVIGALCLIDRRVNGIGFVNDISKTRGGDRISLVTMEGGKEPLPLKSMGDGMTRLFHIILALVNAKNGILLIDEFENGLHWSVQPKVWNVVFQVAEKLNVQVFATTHSCDCIAGFDEAWNTYPELGAFLRLDLKDGTIKATEYTSETLNDSLEMDVEVR